MNSLVLFGAGILFFVLGYRVIGGRIAALFGVDDGRPTPAVSRYDGVDFVPAPNWTVLFGHHFSSIAGAGPVVGPVIACVAWGWMPAWLWVVLGTVFIGGVHDHVALMISVREGGRSIPDIASQAISGRARLIFSIFVWLALVLVIAVFAHLCAQTFVAEPKVVAPSLGLIPIAVLTGYLLYVRKTPLVPVTVLGLVLLVGALVLSEKGFLKIPDPGLTSWTVILFVYALIASVTPVNILLQPRDYLSAYLLVIGTVIGIAGLLMTHPVVSTPAFATQPSSIGPLWPMLFVTVACGAVSGFHSVIASGTTSKQLAHERHARRIGYGAMLAEGVVALLAVLAVAGGLKRSGAEIGAFLKDAGPICVYAEGYAGLTRPLLGDFGKYAALAILNAFILTTLDTATRVCRYLTEELTGIRNRVLATLIPIVLAGFLALSGAWERIWAVFGASNQLVAALALLVATCWFLIKGKQVVWVFVPAVLMFATTMAALVISLIRYVREGSLLLALISAVLMTFALLVAFESGRAFLSTKRGKRI